MVMDDDSLLPAGNVVRRDGKEASKNVKLFYYHVVTPYL